MAKPIIIVVGSLNMDLVAYTLRAPGPGETVMGERFVQGFGGKGANQAVMATRLGGPVAMIGALGDDGYGDETEENLDREGIDRRFVRRVAGSSGVAPMWVEADGTNRIIVIAGANAAVSADDAVAAVLAVRPAVVIGQLEIPQPVTGAAFRAAREVGALRVLNPAPASDLDPGLLGETDWLIPNEVEFHAISGRDGPSEAGEDAAFISFAGRAGVRLVVTLGERGAAIVEDGRVLRVPAPRVTPLDTAGAGDAFVGAFGFAIANGLGAIDAAQLAVRCASASVMRPGTQASFPSREVARRMFDAVRSRVSGRRVTRPTPRTSPSHRSPPG